MNPFENLRMFDHAGNSQNALMQGMQVGTQLRQQREMRDREAALDNTYRGLMSGDTSAINSLANVPGMAGEAYKIQIGVDRQRAEEGDASMKRMAQLADLLDDSTDEPSYQRNLAVAQQLYGQLPSTVPQSFDPNWIGQQRRIVDVMLREPQKLTTMAQELANAGFEPGTPEFMQAMRQRIALSDSKVISTTDGGMAGLYGPNGYQPLVVPNPGGVAPGAPAGSAALPPGFVLDQGGPTPPASAPFPGQI